MATVWWNPNAISVAQVDSLTITAVANGGVVDVTINGKTLTYTCTGTDTTSTAAAAWQALLVATSTPAEFKEITWTVSANVVTATGKTPGVPFTLSTTGGSGGATVTLAHPTVSSGPSDVSLAANWLRTGSPALPQSGDDMIIASFSTGLLYNLNALAAVLLASFTRWQSFTGAIGLPEVNPAGYQEYRPTYLKLGSNVAALPVVLGYATGGGPFRERYDLQTYHCAFIVLGSGRPHDQYAVRLKNVNAASTLTVVGTSVGVATGTGEVSTLSSVVADGGATVDLGSGVTLGSTVTLTGASSTLYAAPAGAITAQQGADLTLLASGATWPSVKAAGGSLVTWPVQGTITSLAVITSSRLDKSGDTVHLGSTVTNGNVDVDTAVINDPNNCLVYTNPLTANNACSSGPLIFGPGRTLQIV
jgi:hypothetical protein